MELNYQNTEIGNLNFPMTVSFPLKDTGKIIELLKESDVKCIAETNEKKTDITFSIEDIEKLNKILMPFGIDKQLDNMQIPKAENKEKLIPVINIMVNLYDRKIEGKNSCIEAHQRHINTLSAALNKNKNKVQTLSDRKYMAEKLSEMFPFLKNPINAFIKQNENKIDRLNNSSIPKLEKQIQAHHTTIEKLSKSAEHFTIRKNACKHFSDVIKSFGISNKKDRNQTYLNALSSLNNDIQQINNEKINKCNVEMNKIREKFPELPDSKKHDAKKRMKKLIKIKNTLENKNKVLQSAQPDILKMLSELNDNKTTAVIDKAEIAFNQKVANSGQSLDSTMVSAAVSNSCEVSPTAAEIVQEETHVIDNINDRDGDRIPDKLDNTFNPKETSASDTKEIQSENAQPQEIYAESDDDFDRMLEMNKDQIPPNDYNYDEPPLYVSDYIDNDRANSTFNPEVVKNNEKTDKKAVDSSVHLVTEEQLKSIQEAGIKAKANRKRISEDGKIPIIVDEKDKEKFNNLMSTSARKNVAKGKRL
ncbi:MAG: hypothetical protein K2K91_08315 [Ruminococcus sp.]|nr:hypothetical protein [Ruminococcus sp.]